VKPVPRLFLDASVWIAAAGSATGGSAMILELCRRKEVRITVTRLVLLEAERNIRKKLTRDALLRFYSDLAALDLTVIETPAGDDIDVQSRIIDRKDAHVLASAIAGRVDTLLTLDRKDFMSEKVLHAGLPCRIMTPGDFLRHWI
jgi:putative PIN family toxin of toxin-antitoxin system